MTEDVFEPWQISVRRGSNCDETFEGIVEAKVLPGDHLRRELDEAKEP